MPQHFHCHAVETKFPRRAFLAGLAAVAPFAARAAAALKIADVANDKIRAVYDVLLAARRSKET